jgi:hypothetical protein
VSRFIAANELVENREFFEEHALDGMAHCAMHELVAPDWLARKFLAGFYAVAHARAKSWDEAFGAPFPKGAQLPAIRRRRKQRIEVALLTSDFVMRHPDLPMTALWGLFSKAGRARTEIEPAIRERAGRIGVSKTVAQQLYAEALARGEAIHHDEVRRKLNPGPGVLSASALRAAIRDFSKTPGQG